MHTLSVRAALAAALALAAPGCRYSFHNAAQDLDAGQVAGRALADGAAAGGATVSLKGSALDQAARPSGWFSLALPPGRHTLLLRQGLDRALLREVELGYGGDGQVQGLWLGELALPRVASLAGTVVTGGTASGYGVVVDETTGSFGYLGTTTDGWRIQGLPVGTHRLLAASRDAGTGEVWVAGPVEVTISPDEAGGEKGVAPLLLHGASGAQGQLHLRVASGVAGLAPADAEVRILDAAGAAVPVPAPDSNGDRDVTVPEGVYLVEVRPPAALAASVPAPPPAVAVVVEGDVFDLGTFTLLEDVAIEAARLSCRSDADCTAGACAAGLCPAHADAVPAAAPVCADAQGCSTLELGLPCALAWAATAATCSQLPASAGAGACLPCGTACTPDGRALVAAPACP